MTGEEDKNERLRALYERANWWPKGAPRRAASGAPSISRPAPVETPAAPAVAVPVPAETHRDLAAIAEINRLMYRQSTPRELLATTAAEIGRYLQATRCLIAVGPAGEAPQLTAEYFAAGTVAAGTAPASMYGGRLHKSGVWGIGVYPQKSRATLAGNEASGGVTFSDWSCGTST